MSPFPRVERAVMLRVRAKHGHVCFKTSQQHVTKTPTRTQQHTNPYTTAPTRHPGVTGWRREPVSGTVGPVSVCACMHVCIPPPVMSLWVGRFLLTFLLTLHRFWFANAHLAKCDMRPCKCQWHSTWISFASMPAHPSNLEGIRTNLEESSKCQPPKRSH
jgi:hypothetical protein